MATDRTPPAWPKFTTVEDERRHRKQRLAAAFRIFGAFGFDEGTAGHITARDPERLDHFWVNPLGMNFKHIRVKDLILVNHEGEVVEGDWPLNKAAFVIHSQIHAARPEVVAAAHSHSPHGKAWTSSRPTRSSSSWPTRSATRSPAAMRTASPRTSRCRTPTSTR